LNYFGLSVILIITLNTSCPRLLAGYKSVRALTKGKNMIKKLLLATFILVQNSIALADKAPFGLDWGKSIGEIEAKGISCKGKVKDGRFTICRADKLPKNISISEQYALYFDEKFNLQKIVMVSKNITEDIYGLEGKEQYSNLKLKLIKKYGTPTDSFEYTGGEVWDESDEFYQCLAYTGCGLYTSIFKSKSGENVSLTLKGVNRGSGYILITYEGPSWSESVDAYENKKSKSDEDAL